MENDNNRNDKLWITTEKYLITENEVILTVKQAMAELHISNFTYYHLVKSGKLKQVKVTAGKRGVLRSEMNRYIRSLPLSVD